MKTIVIIGGIVIAGATIIAVVQNDRKKDAAPEIHQPGATNTAPTAVPATPSAVPTINPAHGLAGHRCDLPVGAPLTTPSGATVPVKNPPVINMNPTPAQSGSSAPSAAPAPSAAGVKVNPAHGLPGHRCDIQVGAPLT